MKLSNNQFRELLIYAFRYALGRQSYAPHTVIEIITTNLSTISQSDRSLFIREIDEAISNHSAGDPIIDESRWIALSTKLKETQDVTN